MRRYLRRAAIGLGFAIYVWFAAVHYASEVKARKAARRARRGA